MDMIRNKYIEIYLYEQYILCSYLHRISKNNNFLKKRLSNDHAITRFSVDHNLQIFYF